MATSGAFDYLIVGAGFAGSVLAERLARDLKQTVLLCDRRNHVGGNAHDCFDKAGVLIHQYGPHIFHTNSKEIFDYLSQFTTWRAYEHRVLASVEGKLFPVPVNLDTINGVFGSQLGEEEAEKFLASVAETRDPIRTSEDVVLSKVGRVLYEKFFRGYTRKQWGLDPSQLDAQVAARIPVRTNRDDRYFTDAFQFMPKHGFTRLFENMLDHPRITIELNADYREVRNKVRFRNLIFTGPIDEFFDYRFGRLPYRSLEFRHQTLNREWFQSVAVVNYPNEFDYTRVTEFKHLTGQQHSQTSIVYEYPRAEGDAYYPIPRPETAAIYARYRELANLTRNTHFVGRLATYRYYNMDQVVGQALTLYTKIARVARKAAAAYETEPATSPRLLQRHRGPHSRLAANSGSSFRYRPTAGPPSGSGD
ncbi:MAG TPA: UDP-galactopyranose mutase [Chthoniobacterales bacterium]|nr:UDP-galactopyranose mutase [Chthoniobacterales bacterium]